MTPAQTTAVANITEAIGGRKPLDKKTRGKNGIIVHKHNNAEVSEADVHAACSVIPEATFAADSRLSDIRQGSIDGSDALVALKVSDCVYLLGAVEMASAATTPAPAAH